MLSYGIKLEKKAEKATRASLSFAGCRVCIAQRIFSYYAGKRAVVFTNP